MQSESLQSKMAPFQQGDQGNKKFFFAKDQMYRQHQNGHITNSFSYWSIRPVLYEGGVYAQVICIDVDGLTFDPVDLTGETSETYKLPEGAGIKMVIYMKFNDFDHYGKFFSRAALKGTYETSYYLIHDFSEQIIDVNWFNAEGNLLVNRRSKAIKLSKNQWHNRVASR